jgi:FAD/FMN-containing dehydrogenase
VRFDAMREIQLPESRVDWVEVEPGVTWMVLEERLRERGIGPTVYRRSAPRSTVGGWLADNGLGVGSFEYGWLLATKMISTLVEATCVEPVGEEGVGSARFTAVPTWPSDTAPGPARRPSCEGWYLPL